MYGSKRSRNTDFFNEEVYYMATTGELRAIIEELQLIDVGDAASYLGEEVLVADASMTSLPEGLAGTKVGYYGDFLATAREDSSFS